MRGPVLNDLNMFSDVEGLGAIEEFIELLNSGWWAPKELRCVLAAADSSLATSGSDTWFSLLMRRRRSCATAAGELFI
jgi:hypothetical protein